ncbi:putative lysyl-tRNA synthetase [Wigglesworthia glossinidia endosymbiont of Glossina morsitans morsitans (Yale colony)]|uniref:Putative lysyl-tRNA synthetase n=1 Tax=Wigglesworthia glossinidia endosymbiont of Glossina morsitans morsitans (Yale colony) TaxID=1142511 RepID=H6Q5X4_WIGGL|nr:putative lysyl-tRNA synthetase [Wigglesworthia glossinidia endosymbiont of Glossina morsitans morsitans (Yale colony)]
MKRLLASGFGGIFQICKSFRNSEIGRYHNPEFTMLEWYRPHYNMFKLIREVDNFLHYVIPGLKKSCFISYDQLFLKYFGIDPFKSKIKQIRKIVEKITIFNNNNHHDRDEMLQILFEYKISPNLGKEHPIFIHHFPVLQSSMSAVCLKNNKFAERFELYYHGIELANGCCELINAKEQHKRFILNNIQRKKKGLSEKEIDIKLLHAINSGIPFCSGVAVGIDRLIMIALNAKKIQDVILFSIDCA